MDKKEALITGLKVKQLFNKSVNDSLIFGDSFIMRVEVLQMLTK